MKRFSSPEVAILIAVLMKRSGLSRVRMSRKNIRQLANVRGTRAQRWYNEIGEELAEYGISMLQASDTHFGFIYSVKADSWTTLNASILGDVEHDFEKLEAEVEPPEEESNDE